LLGAIRILSQSGNPLNGTIRFLFQPGEELLPGGALRVIESGLFDSRMPDLILAQHVYPELPAGWAGIRSGAYMASSDELYLTVKGRGGHAAMPHTLIDPVLIASQLIVNLQQIVSRKAPPDIPTVLSFGKFDAPGATNVIPSAVHLEGTFRTMDETWRKKALGLICRSADGLVTSMGGELECRVVPGYPALHNHPGKTAAVRALLKEYLGSDRVAELPLRMGSEDFARYGRMMPAVYYRLGTGIKNSSRAIHTAGFDVDESAVSLGAGLLAYLAVSLL
ncbi:MAG: amidohydrolase, partial [Bacteroidales bacterium]|nr:amidohydrolase [Bacteroidales bacterium]